MLVVGVDGGGSGSRAVAAEGETVVATASGGPLQFAALSPDAIGGVLSDLIDALTINPSDVKSLCIGAAGASGDRTLPAEAWARRHLPGATVSVVSDFELVLAGSEPPVVAVVTGTGAVVVAVDKDGSRHVIDGRGPLLGDLGGGWWIGWQMLRRGLRDQDQVGEPGSLLRAALNYLGLRSSAELLSALREPLPVRRVAALAPLVCELADQGDLLATTIVAEAVEHLLESAAMAIARLSQPPTTVQLSGGVLLATSVRRRVKVELRQRWSVPHIEWIPEPVHGAVYLARTPPGEHL